MAKKHLHSTGKRRISRKDFPTLDLKSDYDIAMDFSTKIYKKFDSIVKSIAMFGSSVKHDVVAGSDIDLIIVVDDASLQWDEELIVWYREELEKLVRANPYKKSLHINTVKLTVFWEDLLRGDPVVINVLRYGEPLIDFGGFFQPLKYLLLQGKIRSTPESIFTSLQRAPFHLARSRSAELSSIEGLYWAMVDSSHAALIAAKIVPPSPEHIPLHLKEAFVDPGKLKIQYITWYRDLLVLHKQIVHGEIRSLKGVDIDQWQERAEEFVRVMAKLVDDIIK